jgi:hypothetical protein
MGNWEVHFDVLAWTSARAGLCSAQLPRVVRADGRKASSCASACSRVVRSVACLFVCLFVSLCVSVCVCLFAEPRPAARAAGLCGDPAAAARAAREARQAPRQAAVLPGYSGGTHKGTRVVLKGYSRGTQGVLTGYSRGAHGYAQKGPPSPHAHASSASPTEATTTKRQPFPRRYQHRLSAPHGTESPELRRAVFTAAAAATPTPMPTPTATA